VVESARIDGDRKGRAIIRFSRSPLGDEIFQDVKDGIRRLVSVGYQIHETPTEGAKDGLATVRAVKWEPFELTIVPVPADASVGVGRGAESVTEPIIEPTLKMADNNPAPAAPALYSSASSRDRMTSLS
jgi:hypothetical protein